VLTHSAQPVPAPAPAAEPASAAALKALTARAPTAAAVGLFDLDEPASIPALADLMPPAGTFAPRSVDEALDALRHEHAEVRAKAEGDPLGSDDEVCLEIAGFIRAEPIPFSRRSELWIPLTPDAERPGLFEGIAQMKVGDQEDIRLELPLDDWDEDAPLPPRTWFTVYVSAARAVALPDVADPAFLAATGLAGTADELRAVLVDRVAGDDGEVRAHVLSALAERTEITLPVALVEAEIRQRWSEATEAADDAGSADAWLADPDIRAAAERALRLTAALEVIAHEGSVVINDAAIAAYVDAVARGSDSSSASLLAALSADAALRGVVVAKLTHLAAIDVISRQLGL